MATRVSLSITVQGGPGAVKVLSLLGALDVATVDQLCEEIDSQLTDGARELVLDLKGLDFVDSVGLGGLVEVSQRVEQTGGDFTLFAPGGEVQRLLELSGLDRRFRIVEQ